MKFLEKDLEQIIWESDNQKLQERGLEINGKKFRQLRIGNYGIADLVTFTKPNYLPQCEYHEGYFEDGIITIYELKKDNISVSSFLQLLGYAKGIKTYLEKKKLSHRYNIEMILIGKEIDLNSTFCYLPNFLPNLTIYSYHYDLNGISFKDEGYYNLTETGFKL